MSHVHVRWRRLRRAVVAAAALTVAAVAVVAAGPASATARLSSAPDPGRTATKPTSNSISASTVGTARDKATITVPVIPNLPCEECDPSPPCYPQYEYCENYWVQCDLTINRTLVPDYGGGRVNATVSWNGGVSCRGSSIHLYPVQVTGQTMLIDRTPGQNNAVLAYGSAFSALLRHNNSAGSSGQTYLSGANYPVGREVEAAFELTFQMTGVSPANVWHYCVGGGMHLLFCDGVGTQRLHGSWGTNTFSTGIMPECSNTDPPQPNPNEFVFQLDCGALTTVSAANGPAATAVLQPRIRCELRTNGPQISGTGVEAKARIVCNGPMTSITVAVTLNNTERVVATGPITGLGPEVEARAFLDVCKRLPHTQTVHINLIPPPRYRPPFKIDTFFYPPVTMAC